MLLARNANPHGAKSISPSLFGKPMRRSIRAGVKQMVLDAQAKHGLDDQEMAEILGKCKETIQNWREETATIDTEALLNFAYAFGEDAIQPVRDLYLCKPAEHRTILDRIDAIEGEARLLRKQIEEREL